MIDFPCTPEDIVVWKLEQASYKDSYFNRMWNEHRAQYFGDELHQMIIEWLASIVHLGVVNPSLEGILTHTTISSGQRAGFNYYQYLVSVAGVYVCLLDDHELGRVYQTFDTASSFE